MAQTCWVNGSESLSTGGVIVDFRQKESKESRGIAIEIGAKSLVRDKGYNPTIVRP